MPPALKNLPPLPNNIGKPERPIKDVHGRPRKMRIEDKVNLLCLRGDAAFALYLQKLKVVEDSWQDDIIYRLGYYAIRMKGKPKGTWGWAQYAPMARPEEFKELLSKARKKRWRI